MDEYEVYGKGGLLRNQYQKVSDISEGSYGLVSVAKDTKNQDKLVAVKFIYPIDYKKDKAGDNEVKHSSRPSSSPAELRTSNVNKRTQSSILRSLYAEAEKEIRIQKILGSHQNIVQLYDHFGSCLVLEYCSRGDLYEAINNGNGPSTSQDIKDVFQQILCALEFSHEHGVYHRDLKPENILIAEDWSIKLCDWGLATTTRHITNRDEFDIGSERYMAPELFDTTIDSYDASKIDIWSVGIILLTLVFHKNPFQVANYSDKRFLQFVNNREALFDVFSSMSGDMFSVLRYSLNIDPTNRDLANLRKELEILKYFTIDEEYWDEYEYEEEEEEAEQRAEEHVFNSDFEFDHGELFYKKEPSPTKDPIPAIITTANSIDTPKPLIGVNVEEPVETYQNGTKNQSSSYSSITDSPSHISKPHLSKVSNSSDETTIPHNHRADALLSANTDLKPIPIGGSGFKFIRNTRKPFNVASLSQNNAKLNNHNNMHNNNKFIREDFFTPKSVFNHYMDKYAENRSSHGKVNGPHSGQQNGRGSNWKKYGRKPRTWKKNNNYHNQNNAAYSHKGRQRNKSHGPNGYNKGSNNRLSQNAESLYEQSGMSQQGRRKSRSFSVGRSKKPNGLPTTNSHLAYTNTASASGHSASTLQNSSHNGGKYIPPYLRSPAYHKSPHHVPLSEEFDNLNLNSDYGEVFQLEDDFELDGKMPSNSPMSLNNEVIFKKPFFRGTHNLSPEQPENKPRHHNKRPISMNGYPTTGNCSNGNAAQIDMLWTSGTGKYIPPFRRGSHSTAVPPNSGHKRDKAFSGMKNTYVGDANSDKKNSGTGIPSYYPMGEMKFGPSSVPVNTEWSYKKAWTDYD